MPTIIDGRGQGDPETVHVEEEAFARFSARIADELGIEPSESGGTYDALDLVVDRNDMEVLIADHTVTLDRVRFHAGGGGEVFASTRHDGVAVKVRAVVAPPTMGATDFEVGA